MKENNMNVSPSDSQDFENPFIQSKAIHSKELSSEKIGHSEDLLKQAETQNNPEQQEQEKTIEQLKKDLKQQYEENSEKTKYIEHLNQQLKEYSHLKKEKFKWQFIAENQIDLELATLVDGDNLEKTQEQLEKVKNWQDKLNLAQKKKWIYRSPQGSSSSYTTQDLLKKFKK